MSAFAGFRRGRSGRPHRRSGGGRAAVVEVNADGGIVAGCAALIGDGRAVFGLDSGERGHRDGVRAQRGGRAHDGQRLTGDQRHIDGRIVVCRPVQAVTARPVQGRGGRLVGQPADDLTHLARAGARTERQLLCLGADKVGGVTVLDGGQAGRAVEVLHGPLAFGDADLGQKIRLEVQFAVYPAQNPIGRKVFQLLEQGVYVLVDDVHALVVLDGLRDRRAVGVEGGGELCGVQAFRTGDRAGDGHRQVAHGRVVGESCADRARDQAGRGGCNAVCKLGHGSDGLELAGELALHHLLCVHEQDGLAGAVPADRRTKRLRGKADGDVCAAALDEGGHVGRERAVGARAVNRAGLAPNGQLDRAVRALGSDRAAGIIPGYRRAHGLKDRAEGDKGAVVAHERLCIRKGQRLVVQRHLDARCAGRHGRQRGQDERRGQRRAADAGK